MKTISILSTLLICSSIAFANPGQNDKKLKKEAREVKHEAKKDGHKIKHEAKKDAKKSDKKMDHSGM